ncbi:MAG: metal-dependent hydrolase [Acidiferrobacteraceae bacterium]
MRTPAAGAGPLSPLDTLTHGLVGALIGRVTARPDVPGGLPVRTRVWVAFLAGIFPDVDFVVWFFNHQQYLLVHRGLTHSLVMLPLWTLLLSGAFTLLYRRRYSWRTFAPVIAAAIAAHIGVDVLTAFGTMIFAPISNLRVSIPTTFIIDPYFTGIVVVGLAGSWMFRRSIVPAGVALALLAGYISFQESLRADAQDWGTAYARGRGWAPAEVMALPQPLSPFNWEVIVARIGADHTFRYRVAYINLRRRTVRSPGPSPQGFFTALWRSYRPLTHPDWRHVQFLNGTARARRFELDAWRSRALRPYRHFSLFPFATGTSRHKHARCALFGDLRFVLPVSRGPGLLYGICRRDGLWFAPRNLDLAQTP